MCRMPRTSGLELQNLKFPGMKLFPILIHGHGDMLTIRAMKAGAMDF